MRPHIQWLAIPALLLPLSLTGVASAFASPSTGTSGAGTSVPPLKGAPPASLPTPVNPVSASALPSNPAGTPTTPTQSVRLPSR